MAQIREVNRTIKAYNRAYHILTKRIRYEVIERIGELLELDPNKSEILGKAYAMCWASVELFIITLKALASEKYLPGSVASGSVTLLQFMSEYFSFLSSDTSHGKLITASKHITEACESVRPVNFDIPEAVDEFIKHLENEVFPTASLVTTSVLQYLITHLKRKYKGAHNIMPEWGIFSTAFNKVDINSVENLYIFVSQQGALPEPQD